MSSDESTGGPRPAPTGSGTPADAESPVEGIPDGCDDPESDEGRVVAVDGTTRQDSGEFQSTTPNESRTDCHLASGAATPVGVRRRQDPDDVFTDDASGSSVAPARRPGSPPEGAARPSHRPDYGAIRYHSDLDTVSAPDEGADVFDDDLQPSTSAIASYPYGYLPGVTVEITKHERDVTPQKLPELLRHVMLHLVGSRPRDEIRFKRLKYRLEYEGQPVIPDSPFVPRATKSQLPHTILRQQTRRVSYNRHRSVERPTSVSTTSIEASTEQSTHSVTCSEGHVADGGAQAPSVKAEDDVEVKVTGLGRTTGRQRGVLVVLALNDLIASMALSILAPFFPQEARQKGLSDAMSGWIFGVFALVQCLTSPVFGKLLPRFGARFLSQAGLFFAGGCTVLFGMLQFVSTEDNGFLFVVYCFVLRMFMAVGCAANSTATFAIAARTFPDNPAVVFGLLETAVGFGLMMGPAVGGVLYEVGGFLAPFAAIGTVMVLIVPIGTCILPSESSGNPLNADEDLSLRDYLRIPAVSITALAAFIACMAWVMLDPTLEPHLSRFHLSPTIIGLIFLLTSACYAVCSPLWGWVADNVDDSAPMMVIGFIATGIGFLVLGPSPVICLPADFSPLWLDIVALIIIGISISLALVPTYDKILDAAEKAGIPDTLANCSTVAGLWNASYSFGEFVGPVLAGWMTGRVGFPWTMSVAAFICFFMSFTMLVLFLYERKFGPTGVRMPSQVGRTETKTEEDASDERTPLLSTARA